jgi:hypothetical protein
MLQPQDDVDRRLAAIEVEVEAALERTRLIAERVAQARGPIPASAQLFIEHAAARPQPYTIKDFFGAIYDSLPSRSRVAEAIVELFQLYLATRAVVWATADPAVPVETLPPSWGLSGMGPTPTPLVPPAAEEMVPEWPHWGSRAPAPGDDSVVDAAFAAETRKRRAAPN